jgi:hypothetical protein
VAVASSIVSGSSARVDGTKLNTVRVSVRVEEDVLDEFIRAHASAE